MKMGVIGEILPPSVENRGEAEFSAEELFVGGEIF